MITNPKGGLFSRHPVWIILLFASISLNIFFLFYAPPAPQRCRSTSGVIPDKYHGHTLNISDARLWSLGTGPVDKELGHCEDNFHTYSKSKGKRFFCGCDESKTRKWKMAYLHPCCQDLLKIIFRTFNDEMNNRGLKYLIEGGAVVGWWRNKQMVPYDVDLDFLVTLDVWISSQFKKVTNDIAWKHKMCVWWRDKFWLTIYYKGMNVDLWPVQFKDGKVI